MIFKKLYIGNKKEAYIEKQLEPKLNIIFSDDNNKGKTIVAQGLYYVLGNEPIFPSGFEYKNYYFIADIELDDDKFSICRKDKTFIVKRGKSFNIYDSVSDFKRFFDKNIYKLPIIFKDNKEKLAELDLFIQLFFVGQDGRDTSKIFNSSYCNKDDFINMIYSYMGCGYKPSEIDQDKLKEKINILNEEKKLLITQNKILKKDIPAIRTASYTQDKEALLKKISQLENKKNEIIELKKERNRCYNKKLKNESLLEELGSLNRSFSEGSVVCLDCNSCHIGYLNKKNDISFDASDAEIRKNILSSIEARIDTNKEEIIKLDIELKKKQSELNVLLQEEDVSLENLLLYKSELVSVSDVDARIEEIDKNIANYKNIISSAKLKQEGNSSSKKEILNKILSEMNKFYKEIDIDGRLVFDQLFTIKNEVYSGSEAAEFYLSKLYALAKVLNHNFPIVMDAFRDGELSTPKEKKVIDKFNTLPNQIIFTSTLKEQEKGKYDDFKKTNRIDYSYHKTCQILTSNDVAEFLNKVEEFSFML